MPPTSPIVAGPWRRPRAGRAGAVSVVTLTATATLATLTIVSLAAFSGCQRGGSPSGHGAESPSNAAAASGRDVASTEVAAMVTAAVQAARAAEDPRAALDAVGDLGTLADLDRRRAVAITLQRQAADVLLDGSSPVAGTSTDRDVAGVPARPRWLEQAAAGAGPDPDARAPIRGAPDRRDISLAALLAEVAPPDGDVGPQARPRPADPAARMAATDRLDRARAARAEGRLLRAITDLRRAAELDPASVAARRELARSYELIGNDELARRSWQDLIVLRSDDPEATVALAVDAVTRGRPLAALAILRPWRDAAGRTARERPAGTGGTRPAGEATAGDVASIFAFSRDVILLQVCEALGADAAASEVAAAIAASPPNDIARRAAELRGLEAAPAEILRRLGDAELRRGRFDEARTAYARAEVQLGPAGPATRQERAALLGRRVTLAFMAGRPGEAWAAIGRAADADPASPAPAVIAIHLAGSPSEGPVTDEREAGARRAALAALAFRSWPAAIATATDRVVRLPDQPSPRQLEVSDQLKVSGPPWPHPLPEAAEAAARLLRRIDRPFTASTPHEAPVVVHSMALEACGWLGLAWTALEPPADPADPADPAVSADRAGGPAVQRDPRIHVARVRLAGQLRDRAALRRAVATAIAAGLGTSASVEAAGLPPAASIGGPAMLQPASDAWRATFGMATAAALARTEQVDAAIAVARALVASADAGELVLDPAVRSAVGLTLAAALAERAWTAPFGPQRREDLRTAIGIAASTLETRPGDAIAWRFLDRLLAPTGPVADPAARARHRRQWLAAVAPIGGRDAAALERQELMAAGRHDAADDAARLRLLVDPGDATAIEDLLVTRSRADRADDALAWIIDRLDRHPADPAAAAARLRLDINRGRTDEAWDRLEQRLDRDRNDLVALRLAESAAGYAGNRMMRLVMGESRLLQRPPSPARALMLARLAIDAGQDADALRSAEAFVDLLADASPRDVLTLATVLRQIDRGDPSRAAAVDEVAIDLAVGLARTDGFLDDPVARGLAVALRREGASPRTRSLIDALAARSDGVRAGEPDGAVTLPGEVIPGRDRTAPGSAGNGDAVIEPWRTIATDLVDRGHSDRAAAAVARRILAGEEIGGRLDAFLALFVALDAAAVAGEADPVPPGVRPLRDPLPLAARRALAGLPEPPPARNGSPAPPDLTRPLLARLAEAGRLRAFAAGDGTGDANEPGADLLGLALRRAAGVHRLVGRPDLADQILAEALARRPEDPDILNDLGYTRMVAADGRDPEAAGMVERALAADPENPAFLDSVGWLRYLQGVVDGDPAGDDALGLIERSVARDSRPGGEVLLHLGDARWRAGRREAAIAAWRQGAAATGTARHRAATEQQMQTLQIGVWGVLVRDPADMYDALFAAVGTGLRARLAAIDRGGDPDPPIVPTYAERDAER